MRRPSLFPGHSPKVVPMGPVEDILVEDVLISCEKGSDLCFWEYTVDNNIPPICSWVYMIQDLDRVKSVHTIRPIFVTRKGCIGVAVSVITLWFLERIGQTERLPYFHDNVMLGGAERKTCSVVLCCQSLKLCFGHWPEVVPVCPVINMLPELFFFYGFEDRYFSHVRT